eukprot:Skav221226  [mRNA]  locus=scaffold2467:321946:322786:- [translate_table: standard]
MLASPVRFWKLQGLCPFLLVWPMMVFAFLLDSSSLFRIKNRLLLVQDVNNRVATIGQSKGHCSLSTGGFQRQVCLAVQ